MIPFSLPGCVIDTTHVVGKVLLVHAHTLTQSASCPQCQQISTRLHSHYMRAPRDLPCAEYCVQLLLTVRRFFCDVSSCPQRTFAERLPELLPVQAQRTSRLSIAFYNLGLALGGEAGARLAERLHMRTSPDTLIRLVRQRSVPVLEAPRVLGVDDFAFRKGHVYGTILVDLERNRPIDLLPDRTATTLATWLREHTGVEILVRDRSTEYARAGREAVPHVRQVADRWHLLQNVREVLERMLNRLHAQLRALPSSSSDTHDPVPAPLPSPTRRVLSPREQQTRWDRRAQRIARYEAVRTLHAQGLSLHQIAEQLHLSRVTVRIFALAPSFPERVTSHLRPRLLDQYEHYLQQRVEAGCTNGSQLFREIQAAGFTGSLGLVTRWMYAYRTTASPTQAPSSRASQVTLSQKKHTTLPPPRRLVWLLLKEQSSLNTSETTTLAHLRLHPLIVQAHELATRFQMMVRHCISTGLEEWVHACEMSDVLELQTFAAGIRQDKDAIRAALTEQWSTSPVEGQITRLKLIKRQMYGRAKLDLLRQRVVNAA